ncbi:hypothetical protein SAMN05444159_3147 [Bradyrhizobium lablabi]|uniref:Uncharacterized protein n=1 Tax=Bradyrhizobium lablabi TaxID=722472 RepID=A0A1M6S3M8_9BRAD|nr:hypothetical protein SAMN05444159_3147 [Bradyrhizobium lablabi]
MEFNLFCRTWPVNLSFASGAKRSFIRKQPLVTDKA